MLDIINNIDKIHTTPLGKKRIIKNLNLNTNEIDYFKNETGSSPLRGPNGAPTKSDMLDFKN